VMHISLFHPFSSYLTGSNVPYDDSMNLRNILWLAPFPSNQTRAWLAPGSVI
jgi:hypothetical protein